MYSKGEEICKWIMGYECWGREGQKLLFGGGVKATIPLFPDYFSHTFIHYPKYAIYLCKTRVYYWDSLGWLVEFIAKFPPFQPDVQQMFFS